MPPKEPPHGHPQLQWSTKAAPFLTATAYLPFTSSIITTPRSNRRSPSSSSPLPCCCPSPLSPSHSITTGYRPITRSTIIVIRHPSHYQPKKPLRRCAPPSSPPLPPAHRNRLDLALLTSHPVGTPLSSSPSPFISSHLCHHHYCRLSHLPSSSLTLFPLHIIAAGHHPHHQPPPGSPPHLAPSQSEQPSSCHHAQALFHPPSTSLAQSPDLQATPPVHGRDPTAFLLYATTSPSSTMLPHHQSTRATSLL